MTPHLPTVKKVKMILLTRLVRRGWLQYREDLGLQINIPAHTLIDYLLEEIHTVNIKPEGADPWILIVAWSSFGSRQLTSLKNLCSLPWLQISASINDNIELWIFLMLRVINILNLWTVFTIFFFSYFKKLFYFWLRWILTAALGLSLAVRRGYSLVSVHGLLFQWFLLWSTGSRHTGFSSCSA